MALGEAVELGVDRPTQFVALRPVGGVEAHGRPGRGGGAVRVATSGLSNIETERRPAGHAMEPAADRLAAPDRPGPARQGQEGRLEGVLGVDRVAEQVERRPQDHRPVPGDQGLEGVVVARRQESIDEPAVGQAGEGPLAEEPVDLTEGVPHRSAAGHRRDSSPDAVRFPDAFSTPLRPRTRRHARTFPGPGRFRRLRPAIRAPSASRSFRPRPRVGPSIPYDCILRSLTRSRYQRPSVFARTNGPFPRPVA